MHNHWIKLTFIELGLCLDVLLNFYSTSVCRGNVLAISITTPPQGIRQNH